MFVALALLLTLAPLAAPDASAINCSVLPGLGPGTPPSTVTVYTDCLYHCDVIVTDGDNLFVYPECLGPEL